LQLELGPPRYQRDQSRARHSNVVGEMSQPGGLERKSAV
jgi:hypothetical protein